MFNTSLVGTTAAFICRLWLSPHQCLYVASTVCHKLSPLLSTHPLLLSLCLSIFLLILFFSTHLALPKGPQRALLTLLQLLLAQLAQVGWSEMFGEVLNSNIKFLAARSRLGLNMGESELVGRVTVCVLSGGAGKLGTQPERLLEEGGFALTALTAPTPGPKPAPSCLVPAWKLGNLPGA